MTPKITFEMTSKPQILLVDDEERFRANLQKMLGAQGLTVSAAASGEEALGGSSGLPPAT